MSAKSIKKNYIFNLSYQILQLLTPLITAPHLSRVLGADGIGIVSYAESILSYFLLFASLGIGIYGQREISYARDSQEKRSVVFWNTKLLSLGTSLLMLVVYLAFAMTRKNRVIYLILSLGLLSSAADVTWFFQGMEEFGKIVLRNVILKIANVAYVFLFIRSPADIPLYALGHVIFGLLGNLSLWGYLPKYIIKIPLKQLTPLRDLKIILSLFLPTVAIQVYTVLDKTMIGVITRDAFQNGYYEQALRISKMTLTAATSITAVMIPRIGYYFEKNNRTEVIRLICQSFRFLWLLGIPLCMGLVVVADNFVPWFFGAGYEDVANLLKILAFLIPLIGTSGIIGTQYWVPTKRHNLMTKTVVLGACVNFFMNIVLIRLLQSTGAALASVAAECAVTISQLYLVRKELPLYKIFRDSLNYVISVGVMTVFLKIFGFFLVPSFLNTVTMVASGAAIYFSVLVLLKDEFFTSNMKIIWNKFAHKKS